MPSIDESWFFGGPDVFDFFAKEMRAPSSGGTNTQSVTASDTLFSSESVTRSAQIFSRTVSNTVFSSESSSRAAQAENRTTSDTLFTSEGVAR